MTNPENCVECGTWSKWSAWRNEEGQILCPRCVSPEAAEEAIKRVFPHGVPDKLD